MSENYLYPGFIDEVKGSLWTFDGDGGGGGGGSNEDWIIGDGNTHLWITLPEGRTSPMLGVCPNGTVTVDWGDGSAPNVLTGTSTSTVKWTPKHEYAAAGDYVITLTVDGEMAFDGKPAAYGYAYILRYSTDTDARNRAYQNALKKIEMGNGITSIGNSAFGNCYSLANITIPKSVTSIGERAFQSCYNITNIAIPEGVTSIGAYTFDNCCSLANITIPKSVTSIGNNALSYCYSLTNIVLPESVTNIQSAAFSECRALANITIPKNVTSIAPNMLSACCSLTSVAIPASVTQIEGGAFSSCSGMKIYDFTNHTAVPTLTATSAFNNIPADCEIRVPAALVDEWKAATNWSTYANKIVGV